MDDPTRQAVDILSARIERLEDTCAEVHVSDVGQMTATKIILASLFQYIAMQCDRPDEVMAGLRETAMDTARNRTNFNASDASSEERFRQSTIDRIDLFFDGASISDMR